ncbi:hypothetical protein NDU88_001647 [Pleurodeles waltl]|uniref:Uncharacterized protein n=1 Tax=Pleurodeles waltl TaxID=8319 RepID=A0AAV7MKC9_PLEWA|nr:hypothetical protein NDU88_001647 [Pleurodeles waltl]
MIIASATMACTGDVKDTPCIFGELEESDIKEMDAPDVKMEPAFLLESIDSEADIQTKEPLLGQQQQKTAVSTDAPLTHHLRTPSPSYHTTNEASGVTLHSDHGRHHYSKIDPTPVTHLGPKSSSNQSLVCHFSTGSEGTLLPTLGLKRGGAEDFGVDILHKNTWTQRQEIKFDAV